MKRARNTYILFDGYCWGCYPHKSRLPIDCEKPTLEWIEPCIDQGECQNIEGEHEETQDTNRAVYLSCRYVMFRAFFGLNYGSEPYVKYARYMCPNNTKIRSIFSKIKTHAEEDVKCHIQLKLMYYYWVLKQLFSKDLRKYIFTFILPLNGSKISMVRARIALYPVVKLPDDFSC